MPLALVGALCAIQVCLLKYHLTRLNLLTAVYGFVLTAMVVLCELLQMFSENLRFEACLSNALFTERLNALASSTLVAASCLYHGCALFWADREKWVPRDNETAVRDFARETALPTLILGGLLLIATCYGTLITEQPYASDRSLEQTAMLSSAGTMLLSMYLIVMALVFTIRGEGYESRSTIVVAILGLALVIVFRSLRGDRGGGSIYLVSLMALFLIYSKRPTRQKYLWLSAMVLAVLIFFQSMAFTRHHAAEYGLLGGFAEGFQRNCVDVVFGPNGFDPSGIQLLPQGYWHLLNTIDLYDQGVSLNGSSFYNLIPQMLPDSFAQWIGYERPLNISWRLAEYRNHSGGMFLIAEGYWNLGLAGALLVTLALARAATAYESWVRRQDAVLLGAYLGLLGLFSVGMFYGLQSMVRGWEINIALAILLKYMMRHRQRGPGKLAGMSKQTCRSAS
ncbi:MAG TPA: hypothetical protein VGP72_25630 [Planctomycetota bacterium]